MKRLKSELDKLEEELQSLDQKQPKIEIPEDPNIFCHKILGFTPTQYQQQFIASFKENRWIALRWCRQSGKTHIVSAMLLWYALRNPNIHIAVVGPSWRQTKKIISVINAFLTRLPKPVYNKPQKTKVSLKNGSVIEAFPNNPETIRGFTFHVIYCDEMNFIPNDADLYDAILFTLGTTAGKFICSSTPGSTDSLFWKIFNDKAFEKYAKHHITWREAVEPGGPLKREMLEEIRLQYSADPWRWQREMEAVWVEGLKESEYTQMTSKQIWEQLRNGNKVWLPCKLTRLSDKIVNVPIQRAELHIRKAKAYNVILERADALLSLEEFHPSDFVFLKKHGYFMAQFMDELPVPAVKSKETAYVDALALQVTFTPPTQPSAQQYIVGDSLAAASFQA